MLNKILSNQENNPRTPAAGSFNNTNNLTRKFLKNYLDRAGNYSALQFMDTATPFKISADESEILDAVKAIRRMHAQISTAKTSDMPHLKSRIEQQVRQISIKISGINFFLGIAPTAIKKLSDLTSGIEINNQNFSDQLLKSVLTVSAFDHINEAYESVYQNSRQIIKKDQLSLLKYDKAVYQSKNLYLAFKNISEQLQNILNSSDFIDQAMVNKVSRFQSILQKMLNSPLMSNRFAAEINNSVDDMIKILDNLIFILKVNRGTCVSKLEASIQMADGSIKAVNSKIFESINPRMEYQYHQLLNNFPLKQQVILLAQQKVIKIFLGQYLDNYERYRQKFEPEEIISLIELLNKWYFTNTDNNISHQLTRLENIYENKQQIIFKYLPQLTYWLKEFISQQKVILDPQYTHPLNTAENHSQLTSRLKKTEFLLWLLSDENQQRRDRLEKGLSQLSSILSYDTYGQQKPIRALVAIANNLADIYPNVSDKLKSSINRYYKKRLTDVIRLLEKIKPSSSSIIEDKSEQTMDYLRDLNNDLIDIIQADQINVARAIQTLNELIKVFSSAEYGYSLSHPFSDNFEFNTRIMEDIVDSINELTLNLSSATPHKDKNNVVDYLTREKIDILLDNTSEIITRFEHSYIPISNRVVYFIDNLRKFLPGISFSLGVETKTGELNLNGEKLKPDISKLYLKIGKLKIPQLFFRKLLIEKSYRRIIFNNKADISTSIRDNIMTDIKNHDSFEMVIKPLMIKLPAGTKLNTFIVSDQ